MSDLTNDHASAQATSPDGIAVVLYMQPDRIAGGLADEADDHPAEGLRKTYRTSGWFFASDFLDRVAEISDFGCTGLVVRPIKVAVTYALDEKAYRNVGQVIESVDRAFRAL